MRVVVVEFSNRRVLAVVVADRSLLSPVASKDIRRQAVDLSLAVGRNGRNSILVITKRAGRLRKGLAATIKRRRTKGTAAGTSSSITGLVTVRIE